MPPVPEEYRMTEAERFTFDLCATLTAVPCALTRSQGPCRSILTLTHCSLLLLHSHPCETGSPLA